MTDDPEETRPSLRRLREDRGTSQAYVIASASKQAELDGTQQASATLTQTTHSAIKRHDSPSLIVGVESSA